MPTYEFRCEAGHTTDRFFRTISAAPAVIECPECSEPAVRQVSGGIGLVFKGSGFYITDYGRDGKKPQTQPKSDTGSGDSSRSDSGSETTKGGAAKPEGGSTGSSGSDK